VNSAAVESALFQGYQLRLPAFEGPFDVLLRLVERSHLAITDVSLVAVTAQFLAYVESLDQTNADLIAEFSSVGSRLVVLKSRSLLPRPPVDETEQVSDLARELIEYRAVKEMAGILAERDSRGTGAFPHARAPIPVEEVEQVSDLARELIEYRAVKEMATLLGERDARGSGAFPHARAPLPADDRTVLRPLAAHQPLQLARALRRRLSVVPTPGLIVAARKLVSLRDMAARVLTRLQISGHATFQSITRGCEDLHEARTAFLAVLILARRQAVEVDQTELFGEITIRSCAVAASGDTFLNSLSFED
jgi:chromatin segregation and condensation protein Rec8/ScpA/Scc1 (kleisin family)